MKGHQYYEMAVTRGGVRVSRTWVHDEAGDPMPRNSGGGTNTGKPGVSTEGRCVQAWSARSRREMRWTAPALRWELTGGRLILVTLTYPGDWRAACQDEGHPDWPMGRVVKAHLDALRKRWKRRWGEGMMGLWVEEFQERGAPHFHAYLKVPDRVSDEDYRVLVNRTRERRALERRYGSYEARKQLGAPGGDFGNWLRIAWYESVGSGDRKHAGRGVDIAACFWGEGSAAALRGEVNWSRLADYFWRESGKWGQKAVPDEFEGVGRMWGYWGRDRGFVPVEHTAEVEAAAYYEVRRVLRKIIEVKMGRYREGRGERAYKVRSRGRDGLTAFVDDGLDVGVKLRRWAEDVAEWKAHGRVSRSSERASASEQAKFLGA
jgi:hypothetical protein